MCSVIVFFEDPKGGDFRCLRCQGDYFSKWNLRRHAFQRHNLFVPDDGGPWRPPTASEREDFLLKLDRSAKRKEEVNVLEASSAKHSREESVEQPDLQRQDDVNLTSTFDPNGLLNLEDLSDPLLSGMMRDSGIGENPDGDVRGTSDGSSRGSSSSCCLPDQCPVVSDRHSYAHQ